MFQFKLNEFGLMEMVTEDSPQAVKTVVDSAVGVNTTDFTVTASLTSDRGTILSLEQKYMSSGMVLCVGMCVCVHAVCVCCCGCYF